MRHAIHPDADAEFAEAVTYYAAIDPQLGVRFYREIDGSSTRSALNPNVSFASVRQLGVPCPASFLTP